MSLKWETLTPQQQQAWNRLAELSECFTDEEGQALLAAELAFDRGERLTPEQAYLRAWAQELGLPEAYQKFYAAFPSPELAEEALMTKWEPPG